MERRNAWKTYTQEQLKELDQINDRYKVCLDEGKTERECIRLTVKEIEKQGYRNLNDIKGSLKTGDKVYAVCMGKSIAMFRIGKEPLENGMNILGAHIDSPRIDVKQNPLYENEELAYLDTHYYGGIKKYAIARRASDWTRKSSILCGSLASATIRAGWIFRPRAM